jgi:cytochrome P450
MADLDSGASTTLDKFDLDMASPGALRDPYRRYAELRGLTPVVQSNGFMMTGAGYLVHRYDDVRATFGNHSVFSSARLFGARSEGGGDEAGGMGAMMKAFESDPEMRAMFADPEVQANMRAGVFGGNTLVNTDPPDHDRMRGVINKAFFPRQVSALEGALRELTQDLVRPIANGGEFELMETLANPLPSIVIAEMLGVPRDHHEQFKRWSNAVTGTTTGQESVEGDPLAAMRAAMLDPVRRQSLTEFRSYLSEQIDRCRVERADNLIGRMVLANEDNVMTADELLANTFLLLFAGNETTTRLIANLSLALHRNPDQRDLLVEDPTLIPKAVEEILRFDPPVQMLPRVATTDTEVAGFPIEKGSMVTLLVAAANRDPEHYEDPDQFNLLRTESNHIGFGYGIHFCLGAPLARRETRIAFEELLKVAPAFKVLTADEDLDYRANFLRSPQVLRMSA